MKLDGLKRFYEQVTPEVMEAYLRERGWTADEEMRTVDDGPRPDLGNWWRKIDRGNPYWLPVEYMAAADQLQRIAEQTVAALAAIEERQPTAVLLDLLPASARADFVREILPQVAK